MEKIQFQPNDIVKLSNIKFERLSKELFFPQNLFIIKDVNKKECPNECKKCLYQKTCKGGAKCLTYVITKDYNNKDINCIF